MSGSRRVRMTVAAAAGVAVASMIVPITAFADDGGRPIEVTMTGAAEAPGPGDPDGSGTASFRINPGQREVCYTLTVADIEPATAAHIHIAPAGSPGPVIVPLDPPTSGTSSGCADVDRELALELIRNPENYYVNVHNADLPMGAVRAQLG